MPPRYPGHPDRYGQRGWQQQPYSNYGPPPAQDSGYHQHSPSYQSGQYQQQYLQPAQDHLQTGYPLPQPSMYHHPQESSFSVMQPNASPEERVQYGEHPDWKRRRTASTPEQPSSSEGRGLDWSFMRQHIVENGGVLLRALCPTKYGSSTCSQYSVVQLQTQKSRDGVQRWRAGMTFEDRLVIEGPQAMNADQAMQMLTESIAARLAKKLERVWDSKLGKDATGVEEDPAGARFASQRAARTN